MEDPYGQLRGQVEERLAGSRPQWDQFLDDQLAPILSRAARGSTFEAVGYGTAVLKPLLKRLRYEQEATASTWADLIAESTGAFTASDRDFVLAQLPPLSNEAAMDVARQASVALIGEDTIASRLISRARDGLEDIRSAVERSLDIRVQAFRAVAIRSGADQPSSGVAGGPPDSPVRIFISHSHRDSLLAEKLVRLLLAALPLGAENIRCTSQPRHKLPFGRPLAEAIRDDVEKRPVVLGLMSRQAEDSLWVAFELGASWGRRCEIIPILASGFSRSGLPGDVGSLRCVIADEGSVEADMVEALKACAGWLGVPFDAASDVSEWLDPFIGELCKPPALLKAEPAAAAETLRPEARSLLRAAAGGGGDVLLVEGYSNGLHIQIGSMAFVSGASKREAATWHAMVDLLTRRGFLVRRSDSLWCVTDDGYAAADALGSKEG